MHLKEVLHRIDQRLQALKINAREAERRAGRRDAIRNMRRALARNGESGVTARTLTALAPALGTTAEWLMTGQGKAEADEIAEIVAPGKLTPLDDAAVMEAFGWAFETLIGKDATELEAHILARAIVRILRLPPVAATKAERKEFVQAAVRTFQERR